MSPDGLHAQAAPRRPAVLQILDELGDSSKEFRSRTTMRTHSVEVRSTVPGATLRREAAVFRNEANLENGDVVPLVVATHRAGMHAHGRFSTLGGLQQSGWPSHDALRGCTDEAFLPTPPTCGCNTPDRRNKPTCR